MIESEVPSALEDVFGRQMWMYLDVDTPNLVCTSNRYFQHDGDCSDTIRPETSDAPNTENGSNMTEDIKFSTTDNFQGTKSGVSDQISDFEGLPNDGQRPRRPPFPGGGNGRSQPLERLIEGVKFSRAFIPSYNLILLGFLVSCVLLHCFRRTKIQIPAIRKEKKGLLRFHSGGHIVQQVNEDDARLTNPEHSNPAATQFWRRLQAILSYQPWPLNLQRWLSLHHIPIPTPDVRTCLAIFLFYTLNIFYAFYKVPILDFSCIFIFADRLGLLFVANLPLLYLLAAKNCPLRFLTGWSYEQLNVFHRAVGRAMILMAIGHMAGSMTVWWQLLSSRMTLMEFLKLPIIAIGFIAGIAFLLLALGAKREIRKLGGYELFLIGHIVLQIIALVALVHHHRNCAVYVLPALAIWWVDRIIWRFWVAKSVGVCRAWVSGEPGTVGLEVSLCKPAIRDEESGEIDGGRGGGGGGRKIWKWTAGDHIFLRIPGISKWENHPFTIASHPDDESEDNQDRFRLIIRGQDGFTARLLERVSIPGSIVDLGKVFIDGPYGSDHALHGMECADEAVIVAGGSGIAVLWPLAYNLLSKNWTKSSKPASRITTYGTINEANPNPRTLNLIWTVKNQADCAWINPTPPSDSLQLTDTPQLRRLDMPNDGVVHVKAQFRKLVDLGRKAGVNVYLRVYVTGGPGGSGQAPYVFEKYETGLTPLTVESPPLLPNHEYTTSAAISPHISQELSPSRLQNGQVENTEVIPAHGSNLPLPLPLSQANSKYPRHPSIPTLLDEILCPKKTNNTTHLPSSARPAAVVVCGPDGMVLETRNACARMLWRKDGEGGRNVVCIVEKFGW